MAAMQEYKYVVVTPDGEVKWEEFPLNRLFVLPPSSRFRVTDGTFGEMSPNETNRSKVIVEVYAPPDWTVVDG